MVEGCSCLKKPKGEGSAGDGRWGTVGPSFLKADDVNLLLDVGREEGGDNGLGC